MTRDQITYLRRIAAFGIAASSAIVLLMVAGWTWLLRDGLGPNSIESSGFEAVRRFSRDFWPIGLFCFTLFAIAYGIAPRRSPAKADATKTHRDIELPEPR